MGLLLLLPPGTRLLLAASLLSFCFLLAGAQSIGTVTVTADSQQPIEGGSVTLTPSSVPTNARNCRWFREKNAGDNLILTYFLPDGSGESKGPKFTGRETRQPGCALHITNLNANDSGTYLIAIDGPDFDESGTVNIAVQEACPGGCHGPVLSPGAIAGIVIGCLAAVILVAGLVYYLCAKTSLGRTERHTSNGNISSAPGQNQGATDTKPRTGEEDIQYSTLAFNANSPPQPAPGAGQPLDSNIIYSEIKKK